jgi:glycosyltransferase involved in cell wall biosynthesis
MPNSLAASVITPTFNRRPSLERLISALQRQTVAPDSFEVVVIDDGSSDDTAEWLRSQRTTFALHVLQQENRGPAAARNAGIEAASAPLVLFLDDDVEPDPTLVAEHLVSHAAQPGPVAVIGPLASLARYEQPWVEWEQAKLRRQYEEMARGEWKPTYRQFWTGNASVSRAAIIDAGAFDTTFLRGEDVELGRRLADRGMQFRFNARAVAVHHAERSLASWENAHSTYGRLEVQVFKARGETHALDVLGGNWSRLHRGTRVLLQHCRSHPTHYSALTGILRRVLVSKAAARTPAISEKVCSVLANALYWKAFEESEGPMKMNEIMARGERVVENL